MSSAQTGENNVFITYNQGMNISNTELSTVESTAIPYNDNQPTDSDLWDSVFFFTLIFRVDKYLDKDALNSTYSL